MKKLLCYLLFLAFVPFVLNGQNTNLRTITGTVNNKLTGETLVGVSISVPGTTNGVTTNSEGRYSINVGAKQSMLKFSYIGFLTQDVAIQNRTQIDVGLEEDVQKIDEVVVVGYGTQKKSDLTGAIATVDMHELTKRPVGSIDQALQGQVAGVDVTANSGTPGGAVMVRIRGVGTLNDANPLFVVDGMMVNDIDFLNSNDIESMQVLKDASATAIYGSRGSNGVVIITTKRGSKGASKVAFSSYYGIQDAWRSTNVLDGPTWGYLTNESYVAAGREPLIADPSILPTTDWFKEISNKHAPISNIDLSVAGGSDKGDYFFSINKFAQDGIIKKTGFDRLTFRANSTYTVKPWLKIGENITLVKSNFKSQAESDEWTSMIVTSYYHDPASPVRNPDGTFAKSIYNDIWNPVATIEYTNSKLVNYRTIGNLFADIALKKGLVFRSSYSFEYSFGEFNDYTPVYYVFSVQRNDVSKLVKQNRSNFLNQWSNTLSYETKINDHTISALLGAETYSEQYKSNGINVTNVPNDNPDIRFIDNALGKNQATVSGSMYQIKQLSALARLNYSYKDRYLFTANFRTDGSSKFTKGHRWGYFPSFSLGWKLSEESFFKSIKSISSLKLRCGWGQIGNQGSVAPYQYVTSAAPGANYIWGGVLTPGFSFPGSGNTEIKWETSTTANLGMDFGLFKGKLSGTVEHFIKNTTGMLLQVPIPGQTGIQNVPTQNAGEMKNTGIEISLQYRNMEHAFTYSVGGNFSKIINKVVSLGANNGFIDGAKYLNTFYLTRTIVGQPIAQFYGYKTNGLFQNKAEIAAQTAQPNAQPGDVRYVDADKDGVVEFYSLGSPLPKFSYSFNASCAFKGFDLSCTFTGVYGNKIFNGPSMDSWMRDAVNRWTGEGTQNNARYPRLCLNNVNNSYFSDRFLEDGSYLRIKNLQLGYNLNQSIVRRFHFENVRLYVNAQNLYTFTKYRGLDPEIGMRNGNPLDIGVDRGFYPPARAFSLGLNVTF